MPSQINQGGNVVNITANYLKTKPSTRFATRDLAFLVIDMDISSYFNNYLDPDSNFSKVVRLVQTQAEIYGVGEPASGVVTIIVAIDTAANGEDGSIDSPYGNSMAKTINQALNSAGISPDSVHFRKLVGANLNTTQDMLDYKSDGSTV